MLRVPLCLDRSVEELTERYELLERVRASCDRHRVDFLAFRLTERRLEVVLDGKPESVQRALVGLRRGVAHAFGRRGRALRLQVAAGEPIYDLHATLVELHRPTVDGTPDATLDPLVSPWTSHRDLMALRRAPFIDGDLAAARVDARQVHLEAGGGSLPPGWPPDASSRVSLELLLRVASAVLGVLPADRRSFSIFAHLARRAGYRVSTIAEALTLTPRRIRQFLAEDPDLLPAAITTLADPRLRRVP